MPPLFEFPRNLVDQKSGMFRRAEGFQSPLEHFALQLGGDEAEGDAGNNVVAVREPEICENRKNIGGASMDDGDDGVVFELLSQTFNKFRIEFDEDQSRFWAHSRKDFATVAALAWAVFDDDSGLGKVHFVGNTPRECLGTWHHVCDLARVLKKPLEKKGVHIREAAENLSFFGGRNG